MTKISGPAHKPGKNSILWYSMRVPLTAWTVDYDEKLVFWILKPTSLTQHIENRSSALMNKREQNIVLTFRLTIHLDSMHNILRYYLRWWELTTKIRQISFILFSTLHCCCVESDKIMIIALNLILIKKLIIR